MEERQYWLGLFTATTWEEFINSGATVYGLNERFKVTAGRTKPGDYLICYVAGISRFIGVLEILSAPFWDNSEIWTYDIYPIRLKVKIVQQLTLETAIPVKELSSKLSMFQNLSSPSSWASHFRNSLKSWKSADAKVVIEALTKAKQNPVEHPLGKARVTPQRYSQ
jgi:predicted RNA-binding protein